MNQENIMNVCKSFGFGQIITIIALIIISNWWRKKPKRIEKKTIQSTTFEWSYLFLMNIPRVCMYVQPIVDIPHTKKFSWIFVKKEVIELMINRTIIWSTPRVRSVLKLTSARLVIIVMLYFKCCCTMPQ